MSRGSTDQRFTDEAAVRNEMTRTFDVCQGCRRCVDLCGSFPTLFELIDRHDDRDAGRLTPADQDRVVDLCHQCNLCAVGCPHSSALDRHDATDPGVDVPRLMVRARAMHRASGKMPIRERLVPVVVSRSGVVGSLAAPIAARVANSEPGSRTRRVAERVVGVSSERVLPPIVRNRFSSWFRMRTPGAMEDRQGAVAVFPSCLVEHSDPSIGHDLVKVYEHNRIACSVPDVGCCGAPLLHAGDTKRFTATAMRVVRQLAVAVRSGNDVVVPQPACHHVLRHDYLDHLAGTQCLADAELVAEHTYDAAEYLVALDRGAETSLDTTFVGAVPRTVTCHAPCHLRTSDLGDAAAELLRLTGAQVTTIAQCSGAGGAWGLRADHERPSAQMGARLADLVEQANGDVVAGSCHLANTVISTQAGISPPTGEPARHPLQLLARAYGIETET